MEISNDILLSKLATMRSWIDQRVTLQAELNEIKSKTPKSNKPIEKKLKQIRNLTQDLLDLSLFIARQKTIDRLVNHKRWETMLYLFQKEEELLNGRIISPTLALTLLIGNIKEKPEKEIQAS